MYLFGLIVITLIIPPAARLTDSTRDYSVADENCKNENFEDCTDRKCGNTEEEKSVICYFTAWSMVWKSPAQFSPEHVNASLCTHINYAFAVLNKTSLTIAPMMPKSDVDDKWYERVTQLRERGVKVLISIGGSEDSNGDHYSRMLSSETNRANFVNSVVEFIKTYHFDGLDMDYEFPGCPQGAEKSEDKAHFTQLLRELKMAFKSKYLLSVTGAKGKTGVDKCFDMSDVCDLADWVSVIAYNYHHWSERYTGAQAPLCGSGTRWGVYDSVKYYLDKVKCPANKVVLGLPFYAQTYKLTNALSSPEEAKFGLPVSGPGTEGPLTGFKGGYMAYHEVCNLLNSGYNLGNSKVDCSYAWKGDQFISFDNKKDLVRKSCMIHKFGLRGAMLWTLDYDDWLNMCGCGPYPLLNTLNKELRCVDTPDMPPQCL